MASSRARLRDGLVRWVRLLASDEYPVSLPEGVVTWFNRMQPYMSDDLQVGIYLRAKIFKSPGKDGLSYQSDPVSGQLLPNQHSCGRIVLQIQAKSYQNTDDTDAEAWLGNISDRVWSEESRALLLTFGCSVISTGNVDSLDGILDDRAASVANFELVLHWATDVLGLPADPIEHVQGSGSADGITGIGFEA